MTRRELLRRLQADGWLWFPLGREAPTHRCARYGKTNGQLHLVHSQFSEVGAGRRLELVCGRCERRSARIAIDCSAQCITPRTPTSRLSSATGRSCSEKAGRSSPPAPTAKRRRRRPDRARRPRPAAGPAPSSGSRPVEHREAQLLRLSVSSSPSPRPSPTPIGSGSDRTLTVPRAVRSAPQDAARHRHYLKLNQCSRPSGPRYRA
jgi:hypothetical protein